MKTMTIAEPKKQELNDNGGRTRGNEPGVLRLPGGLLGFEQAKNYILLGSPEEAPFLRLQMNEEPRLAFLAIEPSVAVDGYQPDLSDEDTEFLALEKPEDALLFNIVTLHRDGTATVNLKGPIVVNRRTLIGRQIIPLNSAEYSLQHALGPMAPKICA
ncbi:MAG: flagellar assembly factor FliW [Verrucomicrobiota bacterium]|jgi:flagellar assembly factor FliW